jgi:phage shock protein A
LVASLSQQNEDITKLQTKLADAKQREASFATRRATAGNRIKVREKLHDERINDAFLRFETAERQLDQMEGRVEAYDLGRTPPLRGPTLEEELANLAADASMNEELEALRARLGNRIPQKDPVKSEG